MFPKFVQTPNPNQNLPYLLADLGHVASGEHGEVSRQRARFHNGAIRIRLIRPPEQDVVTHLSISSLSVKRSQGKSQAFMYMKAR